MIGIGENTVGIFDIVQKILRRTGIDRDTTGAWDRLFLKHEYLTIGIPLPKFLDLSGIPWIV